MLQRFLQEDFDLTQDPITLKNRFLEIFGHLKGSSFNPCRATIKTFFDYLIQNKIYLDSNPIDLVKRRKEAKKLVDPFKDREIEIVLDKCSPQHRFMYEVLLNTGVRLDELRHLKFPDFNSERQILHIKARSIGGGAKGDKSRDIPLPSLFLKKYESYLSDYRLKKPSVSNYVFVSPQGSQLSESGIQGRMRRLGKKLNFRIHCHKFRATYATHLHREGISILTISLLMGHENIETTKQYISVTEEEKRQAQQSATYLGKKSEEAKRIEALNREKQDLLAQINDLIKANELLLERVRRLNV
ncbi:MAG: tyrosine-type recombinase/integrase [Candidatus Hodarchaeota archaeon]